MISAEDSKTLFTLLDADQRRIDEIVSDFSSIFPSTNYFKLCCSLAILLEEKKMLKSTQRLVAFAILHQIYSLQPSSAIPFISFLVNAACNDEAEMMERAFVIQLCAENKEVLKQSANDYIAGFDPSLNVLVQREQLQKKFCERVLPELYSSLFSSASVKNFIPVPDVPHGYDANSPEDVAITGILQNLSLEGLEPQSARNIPPKVPVRDGEVVCVGGSDVRTIDQMAILCPVQGTTIRDPPYLIDNCWQSRYRTEYKELEFIASGSFGFICKASNNLDDKEYAIKKIVLGNVLYDVDDPEPFQFLKREVIIMSMMNHPNVIRYYQAWIEPRFGIPEFTDEEDKEDKVVSEMKAEKTRLSPCLYMQLQHCRRTLRDFLADPNSTAAPRVRVWNQIIEGLRHIHSQNVVHLDLHRGNILMDSEDNAVIADFGLARRLNVDRHIRLKRGCDLGYWMSPEVKEGRENISTAADVFSLGFICYDLFQSEALMYQQWAKDVAKLQSGDVPEGWGTCFRNIFLSRMVSPDPLDRPSLQEIFQMFYVESYVITVPKQQGEFPLLRWVKFVTAGTEEDIGESL